MSIREIVKNKKYKIELFIGRNGNKKIMHYEIVNGGKKEAVLRENQLKIQLQEGSYIKKNNITMQDLSLEWLKTKKNIVALKTYTGYEYKVKIINDNIGYVKLKNLNVKILEEFYHFLVEEYITPRGVSPSNTTILQYYNIIDNMLKQAILWEYIKTNVNEKIKKPKKARKEINCYSPKEVEELISSIQNESLKYQAIIYLALDSGCRRGELTGLTWDDVDFENSCININKITQYVNKKSGIYEKETKTNTSNRKVFISQTTIDILKRYKKEQTEKMIMLGNKWGNSKRVFTTEFGYDMHPNTPSKILNIIIKKYNLKKINFHALRHTSISLMISKGIQTQIISKKAGHSSIGITHSIYSHFFDEEFKKAANVMNDVLTNIAK